MMVTIIFNTQSGSRYLITEDLMVTRLNEDPVRDHDGKLAPFGVRFGPLSEVPKVRIGHTVIMRWPEGPVRTSIVTDVTLTDVFDS